MESLEWGQTPWDNKSREELLLDVKRMYGALTALDSVAALCKCGHETSLFWLRTNADTQGSGYRALELAKQILEPLHKEWGSEDIYRCYFRYAFDLLFDGEMGFGWYVCDKCKRMVGRSRSGEPRDGQACLFPSCDGSYRKITWDDLKPIGVGNSVDSDIEL